MPKQPFARAVALAPEVASFHNSLGNARRIAGRLAEAADAYREAVRLNPRHRFALFGLGVSLDEMGQRDEAVEPLGAAVDVDPGFAAAQRRLGVILSHVGRPAEALAHLEAAIALSPEPDEEALAGAAFVSNYVDTATPEQTLRLASAYGHSIARRIQPLGEPVNVPDPDRPLRLGFVSGDLSETHAVTQFLRSLLAGIDRRQFHLTAYATRLLPQPLTAMFDAWRGVADAPAGSLAQLVRGDAIDILIDLAGLTGHRRHDLFVAKAAPVQATWLGYSGTTGVAAIDYLFADGRVVPGGEEHLYREAVIRLPDAYLCWSPPADPIAIEPLPATGKGVVTFGSFNKINKISDATVLAWSRILEAVPGSRLVLKSSRRADARLFGSLLARFATEGIGENRILPRDYALEHRAHLASYNEIDIGLDPFPYNGTTTTMEALWMGVPVLTLTGRSFVSRVGESLLSQGGLADWIADDVDDYVARAVAFANDLDRLSVIRGTLRDKVLASPLCDAPRFARNFEAALRAMWARWCASRQR